MKKLSFLSSIAAVSATPLFAASGPFFSLKNTDFIVLLGFLTFIGILVWKKVPALIGRLLDERAEGIQKDLDEARALREAAQLLLADYERKQLEVKELAETIVSQAKKDAQVAAEKAKEDLKLSIERRMTAAKEQIAAAEASAIRDVRNTAISVAIGAASDVISKKMTAADANKLIDESIADSIGKLH